MRNRCKALLFLCVILLTSRLLAQGIEFGGSFGSGVRGTETSVFGGNTSPIGGVYVSSWWADRIETAFRVAWLDLPDDRGSATYYYGCEARDSTGRCLQPSGSFRSISRCASPRRFMGGQGIYHFRRGSKLRPFVGGAIGAVHDSEVVSCEIAGCELLLPGLSPVLGTRTSSRWEVSDIFGVSTLVSDHFVIRGTVEFHSPFLEELSLFETSIGVGYRF